MKYIIFFAITFLLNSTLNAQIDWDKTLEQMDDSTFDGLMLNDSLVGKFLKEYRDLADKYEIDYDEKIRGLYWILIEPESNIPRELTEFNLSKIDKERKLILLSRACLLDSNILKATLFRELSHYFGLPYNIECCEIMRVNKPKGYSYAWIGDKDITEIEFDKLFTEIMKF